MDVILELINSVQQIQPDFIEWIISVLENLTKELTTFSLKHIRQSDISLEQSNDNDITNAVLNSVSLNQNIGLDSDYFKNENETQILPDENTIKNDIVFDTICKMERLLYILANDALSFQERRIHSKKFFKYLDTLRNMKVVDVFDKLDVNDACKSIETFIFLETVKSNFKN